MLRQAAAATTLALAFGLAGCADQVPTDVGLSRAAAAALVQQGGADHLTLHPSGFGEKSYAAWKAQEGQSDSRGNADHALYFQKMVPTTTVAAGIAVIEGVEGLTASAITGLSWEHRPDGHCGAGAPRWNLGLEGPAGQRFTVFLGCAAAIHTPGGTDDEGRVWIRDSYPGVGVGSIADQVLAQTDFPVGALRVRSLLIVFDEGNELLLRGFVHLDNITVSVNNNATVFTGPMDNGG
jgi:hypothetical protein